MGHWAMGYSQKEVEDRSSGHMAIGDFITISFFIIPFWSLK